MHIKDFDYELPPRHIAQTPIEPRDHSRLMILNKTDCSLEHRHFYQITDYLQPGDALVFNDSRVIPARLRGFKQDTGVKVELLLLRRLNTGEWEALVRPAKRLPPGSRVTITDKDDKAANQLTAEIIESRESGIRVVKFSDERQLEVFGRVPLPPYIHKPLTEPERYQTVYARIKGSAAAPTAGLHFTPQLLDELELKGVRFAFVTLHIGLDTFQPVRVEDPKQHAIHTEYGEVNQEAATLLNQTRKEGKRIIAVGTSSVRLIEAASQSGTVKPFTGQISLFILPGYQFRCINAMVTNFHLPESTLIMLVSAFAGRECILDSYKQAMKLDYRFYSFGDAMLIK
jgi:S-adenosylmethionine:tRNA ribosyltransferase-isomerase